MTCNNQMLSLRQAPSPNCSERHAKGLQTEPVTLLTSIDEGCQRLNRKSPAAVAIPIPDDLR